MYKSFIETLPDKVRSAEFKDEGTRFRRKEKALAYRYVELNQLYKKVHCSGHRQARIWLSVNFDFLI